VASIHQSGGQFESRARMSRGKVHSGPEEADSHSGKISRGDLSALPCRLGGSQEALFSRRSNGEIRSAVKSGLPESMRFTKGVPIPFHERPGHGLDNRPVRFLDSFLPLGVQLKLGVASLETRAIPPDDVVITQVDPVILSHRQCRRSLIKEFEDPTESSLWVGDEVLISHKYVVKWIATPQCLGRSIPEKPANGAGNRPEARDLHPAGHGVRRPAAKPRKGNASRISH